MIFLYILLAIIGILIALIVIAPKKYHVERTIQVNKPIDEVFKYIKSVKNQDNWSPWKKKDPNLKQEYVGQDETVGFIAKWEGNKDVGAGEQEITKIVENDRLETELRFLKPWESKSNAFIKVNAIHATATEVTWGFSGVNKVPFNVMMLFFNMEKSVGKDFNEGLESLKKNSRKLNKLV